MKTIVRRAALLAPFLLVAACVQAAVPTPTPGAVADATATPTTAVTPSPTPPPAARPTPTPTAAPARLAAGTLRVGLSGQHNTLDPPRLTELPDIAVVQQTYDLLVMRNPDLSLQPMLAQRWEVSDDARVWTFYLRRGVQFHHGKGFTAEDVVYTFRRLFEVGSPLASVMTQPTDIVAVDEHTVRFEFDAPNAVLLESLVKYQAHITPSDVSPEKLAVQPFGTGPFILDEYVAGQRATFRRNPDYWWAGHPLVNELEFQHLPRLIHPGLEKRKRPLNRHLFIRIDHDQPSRQPSSKPQLRKDQPPGLRDPSLYLLCLCARIQVRNRQRRQNRIPSCIDREL